MAVLQVGYIFLERISFPVALRVREAGAGGAVFPTADFPGVCRLEDLQAAGQQVCAGGRQLCCQEVLRCSWCFVCALCLAVLGYWIFV